MKYLRHLCACAWITIISTSLAGSSITAYNNQTAYVTTNHVFYNDEIAQGFVRLNEGFTVMPHSCVTMDVVFSVSGDIDLRETSTIRLLKDLEFDSEVTLTTGGNIDGRGHTLILNGNFRIPNGKVLHFNGDTIIDAQGNEIVIGENAEIFVDTNVTLTIANAIIKTTRNAPTYPALRCGAHTSKLALDNVVFAPANNFLFQNGQLFVHNDVVITGTSAVIFHSPVPSFIAKNSCLYIDPTVTFSVIPATFTDAPFFLATTYTDNNFIKMADETSVMYLDGCELQTSDTGLRFCKGTICYNDRVTVKTDTTLTLTSLLARSQIEYGDFVFSVHWRPDGRYLAVGGYLPGRSNMPLEVYSFFDGTFLTVLPGTQIDYGEAINGVSWSTDGRYVAVRGSNPNVGHNQCEVYSFDETTLNLLPSTRFDYGDLLGAIDWSPDGRYLAIGGYNPSVGHAEIEVYSFDGTSLTLLPGTQIDYGDGSSINSVKWHPNGNYLAICGMDPAIGHELIEVYSFDGTTLTLIPDTQINNASSNNSLDWSPDGRFLAIGTANITESSANLEIYTFDGPTLNLSNRALVGTNGSVYSVNWSPDGRYVAIGIYPATSGNERAEIYYFDATALSLIPATQINYGDAVRTVSWHPDGMLLAIGGNGPLLNHTTLEAYTANYTTTTTPQALASSVIFGNRAKGSSYDAHLQLQPGASLNLTGKMLYDNVDATSEPLPG